MPRVAFVIPAYNAVATVAAAVRSACEQVVPADEVIVVDDGSVDDTAAVAERAGARVLVRANGGPGAARNTGIQATTAEWIALLDADDVARPDRLQIEHNYLDDTRTAVVHAARTVPARYTADPPPVLDFAALWARNRICTSTVLLRRAAWESAGGFDEARALIGVEDYNLWLRLAHARWRFIWLARVLVDYLPVESSLSAQYERIANAELHNAKRVGAQLHLPPDMLRQKEYALYRDYGVELFHRGERRVARDFFREAARRGRLDWPARLRLWAATLTVPPLRRSVSAGQ